jgi:hypothetical protein
MRRSYAGKPDREDILWYKKRSGVYPAFFFGFFKQHGRL